MINAVAGYPVSYVMFNEPTMAFTEAIRAALCPALKNNLSLSTQISGGRKITEMN